MDSTKRSLVKTVTWRISGTLATFIISYAVVGSLQLSGTIAIIQLTANTFLYFVHERVWNRIAWGKND